MCRGALYHLGNGRTQTLLHFLRFSPAKLIILVLLWLLGLCHAGKVAIQIGIGIRPRHAPPETRWLEADDRARVLICANPLIKLLDILPTDK